tara:strand:+ start:102 stop:1070 length:969 start_codon:yes stop_codon:yes gene_type:complete
MATAPKSDLPTKITNKNKAGWMKLAQNYKAKNGSLKGFTDKYGFGYWANKDGNFTLYMADTDNSVKGGIKPKSYYGRLSQKTKDRLKRDSTALKQLFGEDTFPKPKGDLEVHHKRKISQYAPFFEGATLKEARELARYAAEDLGAPLGNRKENSKFIDRKAHSKHHSWEKKQNYTGAGLPQLMQDGPFPSDFTNANLDLRKYAINRFLANEQPKIDANLEAVQGMSPRARIRSLAIASAIPGFLGTAADAAETTLRTDVAVKSGNPVDYIQAGISGVTTATGAVGFLEPLGMPLELLNMSIDQHREGLPQIRGRSGAARAPK